MNRTDNDHSSTIDPFLLELVERAGRIKENYDIIETVVLVFNALTDTTPGIKQLIAFEGNSEMDKVHLRSLALIGLQEQIQKNPSLITFQRSLLALAYLKLMYSDIF